MAGGAEKEKRMVDGGARVSAVWSWGGCGFRLSEL